MAELAGRIQARPCRRCRSRRKSNPSRYCLTNQTLLWIEQLSTDPKHCLEEGMKFVRVVYGLAAAYGFIVLSASYFLLEKVGRDAPPAVTHAEVYYGFRGSALLWQPVFVLIARDPLRYRSLMPITVLEKLVYTVP